MQVVVLADSTLAEAQRVNDFCHKHGIAFIFAQTLGAFASVFTDFGEDFTVMDVDGAHAWTYTLRMLPMLPCADELVPTVIWPCLRLQARIPMQALLLLCTMAPQL